MSLVKTLILPHSPLLIPEVGKANYNMLERTSLAYEKVAQELKEIDTLIVISPHSLDKADAFGINVAPEMRVDLKDFGFIPPKAHFNGDAVLADEIKNTLKDSWNIQMASNSELDHGSAVPAYLLGKEEFKFKLMVISPAVELSLEKQAEFGCYLGEVIKKSEKKIAVVASGDLSHRLKRKSPGGYSPKGAKFDNKLIEFLNVASTAKDNVVNMDTNLIEAAGECGLKPIVILMGILDNTNWRPNVLAYQDDFGVGYLSMEFEI